MIAAFLALPASVRWLIVGAGAAVLAALGFLIWLSVHDRKVIDAHERKATVEAYAQRQKVNQQVDAMPPADLCASLDGAWNKEAGKCE